MARKSGEGTCCTCENAHSTRYALSAIFFAFAELFSLLFLVVSFQHSLTLVEPITVLKISWWISACRVVCGEVDWYNANFRL